MVRHRGGRWERCGGGLWGRYQFDQKVLVGGAGASALDDFRPFLDVLAAQAQALVGDDRTDPEVSRGLWAKGFDAELLGPVFVGAVFAGFEQVAARTVQQDCQAADAVLRVMPLDLHDVRADWFEEHVRQDGLTAKALGGDRGLVLACAISAFGETQTRGPSGVDESPTADGQYAQPGDWHRARCCW